MIRILVVDDHELVRFGLCGLLASQPGLCVCGSAADGPGGVCLAATERPDVVLVDLVMPGVDGVETTRRILASTPRTRVLMLTWHRDPRAVHAALAAGACGYLLKESRPDTVVEAVRAAHRGERVLDPAVARLF